MSLKERATYLGDGVYAWFDGYMIWLRTRREAGWHEIALEPPVFAELQAFAQRFWPTPTKDNPDA